LRKSNIPSAVKFIFIRILIKFGLFHDLYLVENQLALSQDVIFSLLVTKVIRPYDADKSQFLFPNEHCNAVTYNIILTLPESYQRYMLPFLSNGIIWRKEKNAKKL
jgi:hypothetical protein